MVLWLTSFVCVGGPSWYWSLWWCGEDLLIFGLPCIRHHLGLPASSLQHFSYLAFHFVSIFELEWISPKDFDDLQRTAVGLPLVKSNCPALTKTQSLTQSNCNFSGAGEHGVPLETRSISSFLYSHTAAWSWTSDLRFVALAELHCSFEHVIAGRGLHETFHPE